MGRSTGAFAVVLILITACGAPASRQAKTPATGQRPAGTAYVGTTTTVPGSTTTTLDRPAAGTYWVATPASNPVSYSATPGGDPVGTLPSTTWGGPTVRPVISETDKWVQIGLDSRPNGSTAWVPRDAMTIEVTGYRIEVSISQRSLTLYQNGSAVYSSPVGVGMPESPTPEGRTFVDALVATPDFQQYIYGPTVLVLGSHSNVFTEFDGGDGTVAIHGYPSDPGSTKGVASSHGCVRASPETIKAISVVPLGSPVDVVA